MTTYNTVIDGHRAHVNAWDGHIICDSGCNCTLDGDMSRVARDGVVPNSSSTAEYTPYIERISKSSTDLNNKASRRDLNSPNVIMTPYFHNSTITKNFLLYVPQAGGGIYRLCHKRRKKLITPPSTCSNAYCGDKLYQEDMSTWTNVYDYERFYGLAGNPVTRSYLDVSDLTDAIAASRSEAVSKSFRDYDALTDLLQFKQTAKEFSSASKSVLSLFRRFLSGFPASDLELAAKIPARNLLKSSQRGLRKIGSAWLAYRYMIMPMIYSYKDIQKVISRWQITTDKITKRLNTVSTITPGTPPMYRIYTDEVGEVRVTSTVVCKYTSDGLARAARVSVNPFNTAWELIPYSFVADWFVNIGDTINSVFSLNFAESVGCCTAIKTTKVKTWTGVVTRNSHIASTSYDTPWESLCWPSGSLPTNVGYDLTGVEGVLRTEETVHYSRVLFNRLGAVKIIANPYLDWKRYVSGAALTHQQLKDLTLRPSTSKRS